MNASAAPVMGIAILSFFVVALLGVVLLVGLLIVLIRNPAHAAKILGGVALAGLGLVLFGATLLVGVRQSHVAPPMAQQSGSHVEIHWNEGHEHQIAQAQRAEQRVTHEREAAAAPHDSAHSESEDHGHAQAEAPTQATQVKVVEHSSNLLWARQQASDAPAWANTVTPPDSPFVVVSTDPYATEEEATRLQLTPRVVMAVTQKLHRSFPEATTAGVPVELINQYGVREIVREEFQKDFGLGKPEPMYKLHARVEVTPELKQAVHRIWKNAVVKDRLWQFGGATGLGVLVVAMTAGLLRFNSHAPGRAGKIVAVALGASVVGAGILGALLLS